MRHTLTVHSLDGSQVRERSDYQKVPYRKIPFTQSYRDEGQISGCQGWIQGGLGSVGVVVNRAGKARGEFLR